eukprot:Blabericola_migrator_1__816@NODE_11_length_24785_cov_110_100736_g8_i0_p2_GENE_NODE_11_length_24785_cov_110_100736_g8_i0NODE_11_length_24785_cov_110_100736_g8_i0_p2_ORF_typecomplete_len944_score164_22_NODE_11_length_24785_cov_110_100736_g8_i01855821389
MRRRGILLTQSRKDADLETPLPQDDLDEGDEVIFQHGDFVDRLTQPKDEEELRPRKKRKLRHNDVVLSVRGEVKATLDTKGDQYIEQTGRTQEQLSGDDLFPMIIGFRGTLHEEWRWLQRLRDKRLYQSYVRRFDSSDDEDFEGKGHRYYEMDELSLYTRLERRLKQVAPDTVTEKKRSRKKTLNRVQLHRDVVTTDYVKLKMSAHDPKPKVPLTLPTQWLRSQIGFDELRTEVCGDERSTDHTDFRHILSMVLRDDSVDEDLPDAMRRRQASKAYKLEEAKRLHQAKWTTEGTAVIDVLLWELRHLESDREQLVDWAQRLAQRYGAFPWVWDYVCNKVEEAVKEDSEKSLTFWIRIFELHAICRSRCPAEALESHVNLDVSLLRLMIRSLHFFSTSGMETRELWRTLAQWWLALLKAPVFREGPAMWKTLKGHLEWVPPESADEWRPLFEALLDSADPIFSADVRSLLRPMMDFMDEDEVVIQSDASLSRLLHITVSNQFWSSSLVFEGLMTFLYMLGLPILELLTANVKSNVAVISNVTQIPPIYTMILVTIAITHLKSLDEPVDNHILELETVLALSAPSMPVLKIIMSLHHDTPVDRVWLAAAKRMFQLGEDDKGRLIFSRFKAQEDEWSGLVVAKWCQAEVECHKSRNKRHLVDRLLNCFDANIGDSEDEEVANVELKMRECVDIRSQELLRAARKDQALLFSEVYNLMLAVTMTGDWSSNTLEMLRSAIQTQVDPDGATTADALVWWTHTVSSWSHFALPARFTAQLLDQGWQSYPWMFVAEPKLVEKSIEADLNALPPLVFINKWAIRSGVTHLLEGETLPPYRWPCVPPIIVICSLLKELIQPAQDELIAAAVPAIARWLMNLVATVLLNRSLTWCPLRGWLGVKVDTIPYSLIGTEWRGDMLFEPLHAFLGHWRHVDVVRSDLLLNHLPIKRLF